MSARPPWWGWTRRGRVALAVGLVAGGVAAASFALAWTLLAGAGR